MTHWLIPGIVCAGLALLQPVASAAMDEQLESIRQLGRLNAVALHCQALKETRRMKQALVLHLPRRRQLGELFDTESHEAFLDFIKNNASCPGPGILSGQVTAAIAVLKQAYPRP